MPLVCLKPLSITVTALLPECIFCTGAPLVVTPVRWKIDGYSDTFFPNIGGDPLMVAPACNPPPVWDGFFRNDVTNDGCDWYPGMTPACLQIVSANGQAVFPELYWDGFVTWYFIMYYFVATVLTLGWAGFQVAPPGVCNPNGFTFPRFAGFMPTPASLTIGAGLPP
jgi:hypothetical protein